VSVPPAEGQVPEDVKNSVVVGVVLVRVERAVLERREGSGGVEK